MKRIFYSVAVIATVAVAAYGVFLSQQKNSVAAFSDLILSEVETLAGNEAGDKDDDDDGFQTTCTVTYNCTQTASKTAQSLVPEKNVPVAPTMIRIQRRKSVMSRVMAIP